MGTYTNYHESSRLFEGSLLIIMGTRLDLLLIGQDQSLSEKVWSEIEAEVKRLDQMLNKFDPKSNLACMNREAIHGHSIINDELWSILMDCHRYHKLTLGYFDISLHDFDKVTLTEENQSVHFQQKDMALDLSGYAKGYALENIRKILVSNGITQALVNFGNSSVLALGSHPHGENWMIGITDPFSNKTVGTMKLKDSTMSTSGNTPNHLQHIINPHTGIYCDTKKMVSIAAQNAIEAEVLSTALMVADERTSKKIIKNFITDNVLTFNL